MTLKQWYVVSDEFTRKTEKRMRKGKPHAEEDSIISAVKKHKLIYVQLDPDGSIFGLINKAGSRWALLVGISNNQHRVLSYVIGSPDGKNWTSKELQLIYWETINKRTVEQDAR